MVTYSFQAQVLCSLTGAGYFEMGFLDRNAVFYWNALDLKKENLPL
jgi:hypothetical protein